MQQEKALPPFRTRIEVLFADKAARAVILRRGPRTHYRLIDWDLKTDTFTCGQWMKGLVRLYDLSPDGRLLVYWAAQYHGTAVERRLRVRARGESQSVGAGYDPLKVGASKAAKRLVRRGRKVPRYLRVAAGMVPGAPQENTGTWTAISPVPYFSALAIWPAFGHWTGGGLFLGEDRIAIMEPQNRMTPIAHVAIPESVTIQSIQSVPGFKDGVPASARGPRFEINRRDRWRSEEQQAAHDALSDALKAGGLRTIEWVHAIGDDVLFAADGAIFRVPGGVALTPAEYVPAARKLIELSDMKFELMQAPAEAMRWQL